MTCGRGLRDILVRKDNHWNHKRNEDSKTKKSHWNHRRKENNHQCDHYPLVDFRVQLYFSMNVTHMRNPGRTPYHWVEQKLEADTKRHEQLNLLSRSCTLPMSCLLTWISMSLHLSQLVSAVPQEARHVILYDLCKICAHLQTLRSSFSAVSRPTLAPNTHWKALDEIYTFGSLLETLSYKISKLNTCKICKIFNTQLKYATFEWKIHFFHWKTALFHYEKLTTQVIVWFTYLVSFMKKRWWPPRCDWCRARTSKF